MTARCTVRSTEPDVHPQNTDRALPTSAGLPSWSMVQEIPSSYLL
jgi:hypothetical protein